MEKKMDVVVIGGGLSGLVAAAYLGRAGVRVAVVEKASELGGRARTTVEEGFSLNLGAHAVYRGGAAWDALGELGVPLLGGVPGASGAFALADSGVHALPTGLLSLLTTGLLGLGGKLEVSRVLGGLSRIDVEPLVRVTASEWIQRVARAPEARAFLRAFFRVGTYTGNLDALSAGAALAQLQHVAKHNVLYLDGGWQRLVDAVRERAAATGAVFVTGDGAARVERVTESEMDGFSRGATRSATESGGRLRGATKSATESGGGLRGATRSATESGGAGWRVRLHGGRELLARAVVLATGPHAAASLVPEAPSLEGFARAATTVKVALLDVALARLPHPKRTFALGTDRPTYVSVHSAVARLAPEGGAVVHALRYEPSGDARADERELEDALEKVQPGFRAHVAHRRFLPAMVVSNDIVSAARGGLAGRPEEKVPDAEGLYLAGDWVGPTGMLLDAALASAKRSAAACATWLAESDARSIRQPEPGADKRAGRDEPHARPSGEAPRTQANCEASGAQPPSDGPRTHTAGDPPRAQTPSDGTRAHTAGDPPRAQTQKDAPRAHESSVA